MPSSPTAASVRGSDNPALVRIYVTAMTGATSYQVQFSPTNAFDGSAPIETRGPWTTPFPTAAAYFSARSDWDSPPSETQIAFDVSQGAAYDPSNPSGLILFKVPLSRPPAAGGIPSWVPGISVGSPIYMRVGGSSNGGATWTYSAVTSFNVAVIVDAVNFTLTEFTPGTDYTSLLAALGYLYYEYALAAERVDPLNNTFWPVAQAFSYNWDTSGGSLSSASWGSFLLSSSYTVTTDGAGNSLLASNGSGPSGGYTILAHL